MYVRLETDAPLPLRRRCLPRLVMLTPHSYICSALPQRARANDPALHTDKTMFSCGSLAPKLQRGGGCVDHGFARQGLSAARIWENT